MKIKLFFVCLVLISLAAPAKSMLEKSLTFSNGITHTSILKKNLASYNKEPGSAFVENKGQVKGFDGSAQPDVKYIFQQGNTQIFLLTTGIAYQFTKKYYAENLTENTFQSPGAKAGNRQALPKKITNVETFRMDMILEGANSNAKITADGRSEAYTNYYNLEVLDVHEYFKITYHEIYPGIDWVLYTNNGKIKYDFVVKPGADPSLIKMRFKDHEDLKLNADGSFTLKNRMGSISEESPASFQNDKNIGTQFVLEGNTILFKLNEYNHDLPLRIDPSVLWASYYGDSSSDVAYECATDASGNVYLTGYTQSLLNIASGGFQNNYGGGGSIGGDAFLVKFDAGGTRLWATYYGGISDEIGASCTVDMSGNVYLTGNTYSSANIASGGFQNTFAGGTNGGILGGDAFLVKFNSNGTRIWATYYGGPTDDIGQDCVTDNAGNVYICGYTDSGNGIASGGHQNTYGGGTYDCFMVKFDASGARQWATYYGGSLTDWTAVCCVDPAGDVYLSGTTGSTNNIASGGHQNIYGGGSEDGFMVKFNSNGVRQWATYYGDVGADASGSSCTDASGNVYLAGLAESTTAIASGGFQNTHGGGFYDAFLVKFTAAGVRTWATYYGGDSDDWGTRCATDAAGNIYLAGYTTSTANIASGGVQNTYAGNGNSPGDPGDAMLVKFNNNGVRQWATYYGGSGVDGADGLAVDPSSNIYICGQTFSGSGIASGGYDNTYGGGQFGDGFIVKFCKASTSALSVNSGTICSGQTFTIIPSGTASYTISGGTNVVSPQANTSYTIVGTDTNGCGFTKTISISVNKCTGIAEHTTGMENSVIYPNPNNGLFILSTGDVENRSYKIFNLLGEKILEGDVSEDAQELDISRFPAGVYLLQVWKEGTLQQGKRIIKL